MRPRDLSAALAALAGELASASDEDAVARLIVDRVARLIPEAADAGLAVAVPRSRSRILASTGPRAELLGALQAELGEGPDVGAEALSWVRSNDVGSDPRWPVWGSRAGVEGVGSLLSLRLAQGEHSQGSLTLYGATPNAFADPEVVDAAVVYAAHASAALLAARRATHLQTAIDSRHVIGIAQGITMERFQLTQQQSFDLLRRLSSAGQRKVRDVAAHIVEHRELPE